MYFWGLSAFSSKVIISRKIPDGVIIVRERRRIIQGWSEG